MKHEVNVMIVMLSRFEILIAWPINAYVQYLHSTHIQGEVGGGGG